MFYGRFYFICKFIFLVAALSTFKLFQCEGIASLSMHSIRETIGCEDIETNIKLFSTFYSLFGELDKECSFS